MSFLNALSIIGRVICGLCYVGFLLGMCLHEKYPIFNKILTVTGSIALAYGLARMWVYSITGEMI